MNWEILIWEYFKQSFWKVKVKKDRRLARLWQPCGKPRIRTLGEGWRHDGNVTFHNQFGKQQQGWWKQIMKLWHSLTFHYYYNRSVWKSIKQPVKVFTIEWRCNYCPVTGDTTVWPLLLYWMVNAYTSWHLVLIH